MSHSDSPSSHPHVALLPSSGMGHLMPFLRLAASLAAHNVQITLITPHPTVSLAETETLAQFLSEFPQIIHQKMIIPPISNNAVAQTNDPFTLRYEAVRRSSQVLSPMLSSLSPSLSAVVTDMSLTSMVMPITKAINLPNYIFFPICAKMLALYAFYHKIAENMEESEDDVIIPGLQPIPRSWLPLSLLSRGPNLLKAHFIENGDHFISATGLLVNTFEEFERESLAALNSGLIDDRLPPVMAIGPLAPFSSDKGEVLTWLDDQPPHSVLYVSFGSKAAISKDQIRELGKGILKSKVKFLWVVKSKKVDREDEDEIEYMVGHGTYQERKQRGLLVNTWMKQEQILSHGAVGGFLSHCGWNSVIEAVWHGIPILAWPQSADQKINADLARRNMVAKWDESWGWAGKELVDGEEIAERVKEIMDDTTMRSTAEQIRNKARLAVGTEGGSRMNLSKFINALS